MIYLLLVVYQLKHFLCDYPLQGRYMLGKFKGGNEWILPLAAHAGVHGVATFLVALCIKPKSAFWLALFDMTVHFTMDRIKASPNLLGRFKYLTGPQMMEALNTVTVAVNGKQPFDGKKSPFKPGSDSDSEWHTANQKIKSNTFFWWSLGLDQGVHHLTHYAVIWWLLK